MKDDYKTDLISIHNPDSHNLIFGQSHFIKTVEDIHETLVSAVPNITFGIAFSEASGVRRIRVSGNDSKLEVLAGENLKNIACGHVFLIFLGNAFPINVLPVLRNVPEIVRFFCATANPVQVVIARSKQGGGVLGVIDGGSPSRIENSREKTERTAFLRKIGYKLQ